MNRSLVARYERASVACGGVAALIGTTALLGWALGNDELKGGLVAGITMKANAALGIALLGIALALSGAEGRPPLARRAGRALALAVALIAVATLAQHLFGLEFGIDQLLFTEPPGALGTQSPNRMGPVAASCLTLLGVALATIDQNSARGGAAYQYVALSVMLVTSVSVLGYAFNARQLFGIARYTAIAFPSAVALHLLALGLLICRPEIGITRRLSSNDSDALMTRRLLPAAIGLPLLLMALRLQGEALGLYDQAFGRALLVLSFIVVFTALIWRTADVVSRQAATAAKAERDLHDRLVQSLECMTDGFVAWDAHWRITYMNAAAERMNGFSRAAVVGRTFWQTFPDALGTPAEHEYRRVMRERVPAEFERFNELRARQFNIQALPTPDGGMVTYVRDVTEQRHALAALRESEQLFRTLGEAVPDFLWMTDASGRLLYANPASVHYTGLDLAALRSSDWAALPHAEDLPQLLATWGKPSPRGAPLRAEARLRRHDGDYRWFSLRAVPVLDAAGNVSKWIGTGADVDDQRRAGQALAKADQRKNDFLATLAHELRNPLSPVRNAVHLLKLRAGADSDSARIHAVIDRQLQHLTRLIDDLMDMSRISQDKLELQLARVSLADVVNGAVEASRYLLDGNAHQLRTELPDEPLELYADSVRLVQVFTNLLTNAARYTPSGGFISVSAERDGDFVRVRVADTGIGIAPEQMPHLFELFFQAERENRRGRHGLGIGLALVRKLVLLHGGTVHAESAGRDRGSVFEVRLRLGTVQLPRAETPPQETWASTSLQGLRVLVVEDNRDAADSLCSLLVDSGAGVHCAYSGEAALELFDRAEPHVLLLDIGLPGISGYDVAIAARRRAWGGAALIVTLTGWGQPDDRRRSAEAGIDHHLVKPADLDALFRLLAQYQETRRAGGGATR